MTYTPPPGIVLGQKYRDMTPEEQEAFTRQMEINKADRKARSLQADREDTPPPDPNRWTFNGF
jgi:hypothetical protein